jgi:hypothetical protein
MRRSFGLLGAAFLYIGAIPLLALVAAFLTGFIVVGCDRGTRENQEAAGIECA